MWFVHWELFTALLGRCGAHIPSLSCFAHSLDQCKGKFGPRVLKVSASMVLSAPKTRMDVGHWVIFTGFRRASVLSLLGSPCSSYFHAPLVTLKWVIWCLGTLQHCSKEAVSSMKEKWWKEKGKLGLGLHPKVSQGLHVILSLGQPHIPPARFTSEH